MSWIDAFLSAYNKIQAAGVQLVQRQTLNFTNATVTDDPANQRTNVTVATLATPTGTGFVHVTGGVVDGAATSVALGSQVSGVLPLANLTHGTAEQFLVTNDAATAPAWVTVAGDLTPLSGSPGVLFVGQISGANGTSATLPLVVNGMAFDRDVTNVGLTQDDTSASSGESMTISAQTGADHGGGLLLQSGGGATDWGSTVLRVGGAGGIDALTVSSPDMSTTEIEIAGSDVTWRNDAAGPALTQAAQTSDALPPPMTIAASSAWPSAGTHTTGAALLLSGGDATLAGTTGKRGGVRLGFYQSGPTAYPMVELAEIAPNRRVLALCQATGTSGVSALNLPGTAPDGVMFIWNCQVAPGGDAPVNGYVLWADAGALKGVGTSGTVTTIGPAEPHCPVCGSDFGHEWSNPKYGTLQVCMSCLADHLGEQPWIRRT